MKEFWIDSMMLEKPFCRYAYTEKEEADEKIQCNTIHVVEYSALQAAQEEIKKLENELERRDTVVKCCRGAEVGSGHGHSRK